MSDHHLFLDSENCFCFGYDFFTEGFLNNIVELTYEDYEPIRLNDCNETHVIALKREGKIGVFTVYETEMGAYGRWLCKSNKCPFIFDEMWISASSMDEKSIAFASCRIGKEWGVIRVIDSFARDDVWGIYDNSNLQHTVVVPFIYKTREEAIRALHTRDYHEEYGWEKLFEYTTTVDADVEETDYKYIRKWCTPNKVTSLKPDQIFVYGSNLEGNNGGGAARDAQDLFGAKHGIGVGRNGRCYAIPTMDGSVEAIKLYVDDFIKYASEHKELEFLLTPIGCGIAGYTPNQIAPLFKEGLKYGNIVFPKSFIDVLIK